jgi:hypothetical protein
MTLERQIGGQDSREAWGQKPKLRQEALEICPLCGEPVMGGAHKCNELSALIAKHGRDSAIGKLLGPIFDEARALCRQSRTGSESLQITIGRIPKKPNQDQQKREEIPGVKGMEEE